MVKEIFESLLEELGKVLNIPTLHPDRNRSCLIQMPNDIQLQIEMDSYGQNICLGCDLGPIPPGRYRANFFREALKANAQPSPLNGILAYSQKTEHVVLFEYLPLKDLTGEKIADALGPFMEKGILWKEALSKGEIPALSGSHSSGGMFGLRP
jgi:hypothetical protein